MSGRDLEQLESDRLSLFLAGGRMECDYGAIAIKATSFGTSEEWEWTAYRYCMCMLYGTQGGTLGGKVEVSAAALGLLIGFAERLAICQGLIPAPGGAA